MVKYTNSFNEDFEILKTNNIYFYFGKNKIWNLTTMRKKKKT